VFISANNFSRISCLHCTHLATTNFRYTRLYKLHTSLPVCIPVSPTRAP